MFEALSGSYIFFDNLKQQSPQIENIYYLNFSNLHCKFQILLETDFLTEILKMRHMLLIMRKKQRPC